MLLLLAIMSQLVSILALTLIKIDITHNDLDGLVFDMADAKAG